MDDPTLREGRGPSAAHTRAPAGATPAPATEAIALLHALSAWMRSVGATRARLPDGTELELGALPPREAQAETADQQRARKRAALREELDTRYAHVGGWSGDDDALDAMIASRRS